MDINFRIGDKVILDKEKVIFIDAQKKKFQPNWYSNDIFTIIGFNEKDSNVMILNKNLTGEWNDKLIHKSYLKLLKTERKTKLLKLNSI